MESPNCTIYEHSANDQQGDPRSMFGVRYPIMPWLQALILDQPVKPVVLIDPRHSPPPGGQTVVI